MNDLTFETTIEDQKVKVRLKKENMDIERKCDEEYHLTFTQLMQKGIMPKAALEKMMSDKGIWTSEHEDQLVEMQKKLGELQIQLMAAPTHEKGLVVAKEMGILRAEALRLVEVKAAVLTNSCESIADSVRRDAYIAYGLVYDETGKNVFQNFDDFLSRADEEVVKDARAQVLNESVEAFNESLTGLPEVEFIRNVEERMTQEFEEMQAEADEAPVATKKVTKKTTTKKKTAKKTTRKKTS